MKRKILFVSLGVCLFLWVSNLCAMECQIVNEEGNAINSANGGELVYFKSIYAYSKPKKLAWNLMVTLPSGDLKNYKTSMKHNGYFFHEGSLENKSHIVPIVIPKDNFIEGNATFKYTLTSNGNCVVYLNISQDSVPPSESTLTATVVSSSLIKLSWTACTDNIGVVGYRVYSGDGTCHKSETGTSTYFDGLNPGTQYCYTVTAYDATGNESAHSNQACATIPEPIPTPEPIPEPTPVPEPPPVDPCINALLQSQCPDGAVCHTEMPGLDIYSFMGEWYLKIVGSFTTSLYVKIPAYDNRLCKEGIEPSLCPMNTCVARYVNPTQYSIYSDGVNWFVGDSITSKSYRIFNKDGK